MIRERGAATASHSSSTTEWPSIQRSYGRSRSITTTTYGAYSNSAASRATFPGQSLPGDTSISIAGHRAEPEWTQASELGWRDASWLTWHSARRIQHLSHNHSASRGMTRRIPAVLVAAILWTTLMGCASGSPKVVIALETADLPPAVATSLPTESPPHTTVNGPASRTLGAVSVAPSLQATAPPTGSPSPSLTTTSTPIPPPSTTPTASPSPSARPTPSPSLVPPLIAVDPGHGGRDLGGRHFGADGHMDLTESEVNLNLGRHVGRVLQERGYRTLLTRDGDYRLNGEWADVNEDGTTDHVDEVQARVDAINAAKVDLVLSIHQNAFYHQSGEAGVELGGTITFYCADRPFADQSLLFAQLTQQALVAAFRELGYEIRDRGVEDDAVLSELSADGIVVMRLRDS